MPKSSSSPASPSRRRLLGAAAALSLIAPLRPVWAQTADPAAAPAATPADAAAQQFSFDGLAEEMRRLAAQPHTTAPAPEGFLGDLNYDDYRLIKFRDDHTRWNDAGSQFRLAAFHMGWLFPEPVRIFEVAEGMATEMRFTTDDFEYLGDLAKKVPEHGSLPGVAGIRLNTPLNRLDKFDELVAFVGASYFRALGRNSAYGLSARGLALNTATAQGEEFPRFSRFYTERGPVGSTSVTVYATLEGPSVTGAYRFVITPGEATTMDVTARLYFRQDVAELGVAPLTSMFLFSEKNRAEFDDYRPNVHDSEGLRIVRAGGDVIWRPLNNPPQLTGSYFAETAPDSFGLYQRDRDFQNYQDTGAHYERRPSLNVKPLGDWGKGNVRLVEIPSDLEGNDNIVAYWVPEAPAKAGDAREFAYRLSWGDLPHDDAEPLAYVHETRSGHGGFSGAETVTGTRKFVIDFKGGMLAALDPKATVEPKVTLTGGELLGTTLQKIDSTDIWRLVIEAQAANGAIVEMGAHVAGYDRKLTETWLYQWINAK
ncbi:glucan biosynthesis protein [Tabrizicola fusiformis]|uniref:glucan biosynthesis protein n=1 Tax=Tabrizicola sp. SY72 TaxID=2741673 RepID=UPI0015743F7C|nr:glucan biosynthesis protein [Tabrizicola sp. SY72]NTT85928.1 glucan biosynthesis protein [Tabrizicola sp. SY72]